MNVFGVLMDYSFPLLVAVSVIVLALSTARRERNRVLVSYLAFVLLLVLGGGVSLAVSLVALWLGTSLDRANILMGLCGGAWTMWLLLRGIDWLDRLMSRIQIRWWRARSSP